MVEGGQTAQVSFTVSCSTTNTAPNATDDPDYQVTAGESLIRNETNGVLVNDTDQEGDPLFVLNPDIAAPPQKAAYFKLFQNGGFNYSPLADFTGTDQFTYQAVDARGAISNSATVTITVTAGNRPPVAVDDDAYSISLQVNDSVLTDRTTGVLANDSDPDLDPLEIVDALEVVDFEAVEVSPAAAIFFLTKHGGFKYKPFPDFTGTAHFTYRARDPQGAESNEATVTITVNP